MTRTHLDTGTIRRPFPKSSRRRRLVPFRPRLESLEGRLPPAVRVWSGGGPDPNWSTAANWGATGVPVNDDDLQFPPTGFTASNNDLNDLSLNSVTFGGLGYILAGQPVSVTSAITMAVPGTNRVALGVRLPLDFTPTVNVAAGGTVNISGVVSGVGPLVKTGAGELVLGGDNTFDGGLTLLGGILTVASNTALGTGTLQIAPDTTLQADGSPRTLANAYTFFAPDNIIRVTLAGSSPLTLNGAGAVAARLFYLNVTNTALTTLGGGLSGQGELVIQGTGTLMLRGTVTGLRTYVLTTVLLNAVHSGVVHVESGGTLGGSGNVVSAIECFGGTISPGASPGGLSASTIELGASCTYRVELNGTTRGVEYDSLNYSFRANLGGARLSVSLGFASAVGQRFTILSGSYAFYPPIGQFAGLPWGTVFAVDGKPFLIQYVILNPRNFAVDLVRVQAATTTTLTAAPSPSTIGRAVTLTAAIASTLNGTLPPTGTVTFLDGSTPLGTAAVASGVATLTTAELPAGTHTLTAVYNGDDTYTGSTSAAVSHTVNQFATTTALTVTPDGSVFGQALTLTATVASVTAGLRPPTGTVMFLDGTTVIGGAAVNAGVATFITSALTAGVHTLTAVYAGDYGFLGSSSAAFSRTVGRAATRTVVTSSANPEKLGQPVTFTATVSALEPGAGTPTGTVSFGPLGTVSLDGGQARLTLADLPAGCPVIVATYQGDANFDASTAPEFRQSVTATPNQAYMLALYRDVLLRTPDPSGFDYWVGQLDAGVSRDFVATTFWLSAEHRGLQVDTLYRELLGRAADPTGRSVWVTELLVGVSEAAVTVAIVTSAEYAATHATAAAYVNGLYEDLLGRPADAAGAASWTQQLESGAQDRAAVASSFLSSVEAYTRLLNHHYLHFLGRTPDPTEVAGLLSALQAGASPTAVAAVFLASPEYYQRAQIAVCS